MKKPLSPDAEWRCARCDGASDLDHSPRRPKRRPDPVHVNEIPAVRELADTLDRTASPTHADGIPMATPDGVTPATLPTVLLKYQRELLALAAKHRVVVCEKSRRIGMTWGIAPDAVITAATPKRKGGMNVFYVGYNLDMTREFIETCAMWAKAFNRAAASVSELLFQDGVDEHGAERFIKAFRIDLHPFSIVALCSRPRSLRGRQGKVIIDEAAFHDDLAELLKAALAFLVWGGRVIVLSTHDGADNPFNELVTEIRAGKKPKYALLRVTFDDAIRDGLYQRVHSLSAEEQARGPYSAELEKSWRDEIVESYGDAADEELHVIPRQSGGRYFARTLIESRSVDVPVLRWTIEDAKGETPFVDEPKDVRERTCRDWCEEHIAPILARLATDPSISRSFLGQDFARKTHLTVMWPATLDFSLRRRTPFVVELRNIPFAQQEQVLNFIIDHLPRFAGAALDAGGNGMQLAEATRQRYGSHCVAELMLSESFYREHMPKLLSVFEDSLFDCPRDTETIDDFRDVEVVKGVARVVERTVDKGTTKRKRHGDAAIAACLVIFASFTFDGADVDGIRVEGTYAALDAYGDVEDGIDHLAAFMG